MTQPERYILQTTGRIDHAYRAKGTLEGWKRGVARVAEGNSRLALAISAAFAAPMLYPTGGESGGIHFRGGSSTGKTTTLIAAGSAYGGGGIHGFVRSWRTTSNGLEGLAAMHNDALLCLDEMGQVSGSEAGQIAYMLANGIGKTRANRTGDARAPQEWRILFLSSGEISLADKVAEDGRGRRVAAGQLVRVIDIEADAGAGHGLFENLHEHLNGDALSRYVKDQAREHYGIAASLFIKHLTANFRDIAPVAKRYIDEFLEEEVGKDADGQVRRVAARFGLIGSAGEMSTAIGLLPWPEGEATRAAQHCFRDWLRARGGSGAAEDTTGIATVRRFIEMHGSSRFEAIGELAPRSSSGELIDQRIHNRVGFRRKGDNGGTEYLVLPEAWKAEVCAGMDGARVARVLADHGLLARSSEGKYQMRSRVPGIDGPVRHYLVTSAILAGNDAEPGRIAA